MSITAVIVFTACGAAIGAATGIKAIRSGEADAGDVALCGALAVAGAAFMILQRVFWSSLEAADIHQALTPDFFSPGRQDRILWWYSVASAGVAGLLSAAWERLSGRRRQA